MNLSPSRCEIIYSYPKQVAGIHALFQALPDAPTVLLGVNGAGKSTLLQCLGQHLHPQHISPPDLQAGKIYVPQHFLPIRGFSCWEYTSYLGWLQGQSWKQTNADAAQWLNFVGLDQVQHQKCTNISGGQQARLQLAAALNSKASFLLLDEPSAALDPLAKELMQDLYRKIIANGIGLWISTHQPHEVAAPFERVLVLDRGAVVFDASITQFQHAQHDPEQPSIVRALSKATGSSHL